MALGGGRDSAVLSRGPSQGLNHCGAQNHPLQDASSSDARIHRGLVGHLDPDGFRQGGHELRPAKAECEDDRCLNKGAGLGVIRLPCVGIGFPCGDVFYHSPGRGIQVVPLCLLLLEKLTQGLARSY